MTMSAGSRLRMVCWRGRGRRAGASAAGALGRPQRVVSFNLCADQLVLALADPSQIAGLSPYAADPVAFGDGRARRAHTASSTGRPNPPSRCSRIWSLIGPNDRSMTRRMLTSQGLRVVEAGFVSDLEFGAPADPRDGGPARAEGTRRDAARRSRTRARAPRRGRAQGRRDGARGRARRLYAGAVRVLPPRFCPKPG